MNKKQLSLIVVILAIISGWLFVSFQQTNQQPDPGNVRGEFASSTPQTVQAKEIKVAFLDVGQGDAALIILPDNEQILIDGGPNNAVVAKLGDYLPPYDHKIERIILTHPHADHINGLLEVLKRYEVGEVILTKVDYSLSQYDEFLQLAQEKSIVKVIEKNETIDVKEGMKLEFLAPTESLVDKKISNLNDSSLVFKFVYSSSSIFFAGDYEQEEDLSAQGKLSPVNILKVGHHGSTNANDKGVLAAVKPQFAVISVGKNNKFKHPHYRTLYYLKQLPAQILRTDEIGDIVFNCNLAGCQKAD